MSATSASSSSTEFKALKPSSPTSTNTKSPPSPPPKSPKRPAPQQEDPPRTTTSRPPDTARGISLTWQETQSLSRRVTGKVHRINLAKMWDNVVLADKRGNISETEYADLISFFFGFVPMILNTHPRDPCVATGSELVYRDLMRRFEHRGDRKNERVVRGEGRVHEWYTRPKEKGLFAKLCGK